MPGSDLQFYKFIYNGERYFPITNNWTLRLRTELGFGGGYGDTPSLPFYEHFYGGGFGSIRGFENSTLGPRSTPPLDSEGNPVYFRDRNGDPFGGNLLVEATAGLYSLCRLSTTIDNFAQHFLSTRGTFSTPIVRKLASTVLVLMQITSVIRWVLG